MDPQLWGCTILDSKWSICPKQIFFFEIWEIFKKFFQWIQSYEDAQFLGPKWPISANDNFFRKPVNQPCFFHSRLSTCQKSKSDINLLVKYWWLKNTGISLTKRHFWLYLENQISPKHVVFAECWWTIRTFILHKFQTKLMTWFS